MPQHPDTAEKRLASAEQTAKDLLNSAVVEARATLVEASKIAILTAAEERKKITESLSDALREVFGENVNAGKFVDVSRIPLICQSIVSLHENVEDIKGDIKWVSRLVIGAIVLGVIGLLFSQTP